MTSTVSHLASLIRLSHTVFALPFALLAALLAWRRPESPFRWVDLLGIVLCMVAARSAAMAFNRLVDRDIDAANPRTAGRHLPAGLLATSTVVAFTVLMSLGFIASTLLFLPNRWPVMLAIPLLMFLCGYSYAKRFTTLCHYWLSAALSLSPVAAWIAITGTVESPAIALSAVVFFWVGGFDILYACQDAEFDRTHGLSSVPARWGVANALRIAAFSHAATVVALLVVWKAAALGPVFLCGVLAIAALLVYEHWLVRPNDLSRVNQAFFQVNAVISVGLLSIGLIDLAVAGWRPW